MAFLRRCWPAWPPKPTVEDEVDSLSKEVVSSAKKVAQNSEESDSEAQSRGSVDQTPIILEAVHSNSNNPLANRTPNGSDGSDTFSECSDADKIRRRRPQSVKTRNQNRPEIETDDEICPSDSISNTPTNDSKDDTPKIRNKAPHTCVDTPFLDPELREVGASRVRKPSPYMISRPEKKVLRFADELDTSSDRLQGLQGSKQTGQSEQRRSSPVAVESKYKPYRYSEDSSDSDYKGKTRTRYKHSSSSSSSNGRHSYQDDSQQDVRYVATASSAHRKSSDSRPVLPQRVSERSTRHEHKRSRNSLDRLPEDARINSTSDSRPYEWRKSKHSSFLKPDRSERPDMPPTRYSYEGHWDPIRERVAAYESTSPNVAYPEPRKQHQSPSSVRVSGRYEHGEFDMPSDSSSDYTTPRVTPRVSPIPSPSPPTARRERENRGSTGVRSFNYVEMPRKEQKRHFSAVASKSSDSDSYRSSRSERSSKKCPDTKTSSTTSTRDTKPSYRIEVIPQTTSRPLRPSLGSRADSSSSVEGSHRHHHHGKRSSRGGVPLVASTALKNSQGRSPSELTSPATAHGGPTTATTTATSTAYSTGPDSYTIVSHTVIPTCDVAPLILSQTKKAVRSQPPSPREEYFQTSVKSHGSGYLREPSVSRKSAAASPSFQTRSAGDYFSMGYPTPPPSSHDSKHYLVGYSSTQAGDPYADVMQLNMPYSVERNLCVMAPPMSPYISPQYSVEPRDSEKTSTSLVPLAVPEYEHHVCSTDGRSNSPSVHSERESRALVPLESQDFSGISKPLYVSSLPPCSRPDYVSDKQDWFTLVEYPSLDICPSCYEHLASAGYRQEFTIARPRPAGYKTRCELSLPWFRMAWLQTLGEGRRDLELIYRIASNQNAYPPCPGKRYASLNWYGVIDPDTGNWIPYFDVCPCCVHNIEALMPSLRGALRPRESIFGCERICDLQTDSKRFPRYIELLDAACIDSEGLHRPVDLHHFAKTARKLSCVRECPRNKVVENQDWYVAESIPTLFVCEECYRDVVWPVSKSKVGSLVTRTALRVEEGVSCQLYSDRMRRQWKEAVRTEDEEGFRAASRERWAVEKWIEESRRGIIERQDPVQELDELDRLWREYE